MPGSAPCLRGRTSLGPKLLALYSDLEALGSQIVAGRDALATELGELGKRSNAVRAYGRGS